MLVEFSLVAPSENINAYTQGGLNPKTVDPPLVNYLQNKFHSDSRKQLSRMPLL